MTVMDFPSSPVNGQQTTDGRYYFDSSVGSTGAWRSAPLPVGGLPAGSIIQWSSNTAPANWLICDGSAVSRSVYSSLFAVIGTTYGTGDGSTTFNLPDLRGRVPVGKNGGTFGTLAGTGGSETNTLAANNLPAHNHPVTDPGHSHPLIYLDGNYFGMTEGSGGLYRTGSWAGGGRNDLSAASRTTGVTVGNNSTTNAPVNNLQPYLVVNYIIKVSAGWTAGDSELATRVGALETADATTNKSGLVPVIPTSLTVPSGTASTGASGKVSFSGVTDIQLNGVFTGAYQSYRVVFTFYASATGELRQRYCVNGTVQTDANLGWAGNAANSSGGSSTYSGIGIDWGAAGWFQNSSGNTLVSDITNPAVLGNITRQNSSWGAWNGNWQAATFSMAYNNGQVVDGIRYYATAGTITGTVQVYGYR